LKTDGRKVVPRTELFAWIEREPGRGIRSSVSGLGARSLRRQEPVSRLWRARVQGSSRPGRASRRTSGRRSWATYCRSGGSPASGSGD